MTLAICPPLKASTHEGSAATQTVSALVGQYEDVERACEDAIGRQERLARQLYAMRSDDLVAGEGRSLGDMAFGEFRQMHGLARKVVPEGLPNASRRFVLKARAPSLVEIEDLEETIRLCRCRMGVLESDILNRVPESAPDAAEKLKFMASLMLDGGNLDVDFFAYLVEECAFVVADHCAGA